MGHTGELSVAEVHARYYESTYRRGNMTAYASGATVSAASTTATGLILLNPYNNNKNLVLQKTSGFVTATSASMTGIVLGYFVQGQTNITGPTAITIVPNFLSASSGATGIAYSAATIANAPVGMYPLLHNTAAINTTGEDAGWDIDLEGSILVPPGYGVMHFALGAASAASAVTLMLSWEETAV
jgi:hypothetical protein